MEDEIGKDNSDTRADKVKEGQDHSIAQQVEQHDRVGDLQKKDVIEPENVDEYMNGAVDEEELTLKCSEEKWPLREVQLDMTKNRVLNGSLLRRPRWRTIMEFMLTRWR